MEGNTVAVAVEDVVTVILPILWLLFLLVMGLNLMLAPTLPCPRLVYREEAFYCEIMYIISISIRFYSRERCLHRNGGSSIDSLAIFSDESLVLVPWYMYALHSPPIHISISNRSYCHSTVVVGVSSLR